MRSMIVRCLALTSRGETTSKLWSKSMIPWRIISHVPSAGASAIHWPYLLLDFPCAVPTSVSGMQRPKCAHSLPVSIGNASTTKTSS